MNPLAAVHYPTSSDADLDRLQALAQQLAGFDDTISLEWLDGAMTALAAGPRPRPLPEWRERLLGDTWARTFADPQSDREATAVMQARWNVLLRQLDPELLIDAPDDLRLAPVMLEWSDADEPPDEASTGDLPRTGEVWAIGFMEVVATFVEDWPEDAASFGDQAEAYEDALARVALLGLGEAGELDAAVERLHAGAAPTRDELIEDALYAVQDLRVFFVENAARPETRRVGPQPGRNDLCPCGSGLKFKKCHGKA